MLSYAYEIATLIAIFVIASLGLAMVVSQAGLLSLAHGSFLGLGAYAYAVLVTQAGWPVPAAIVMAIALPALIGALVAYFGSEFDEERFAVATLAFNVLIVNIMVNWAELTRGADGISQIPRVSFLGYGSSRPEFLTVCVVAAVVVYVFLQRLTTSGFGTLLRASGLERHVVEALGASVIWLRVKAVALGGGIAGVAGTLLAMHSGYIAPQMFELHLSILLLAMVVMGSSNSMAGTALGAGLLVLVPELLRFTASSATSAGPLRQVVFGVLLLVVIFAQAWRKSKYLESQET